MEISVESVRNFTDTCWKGVRASAMGVSEHDRIPLYLVLEMFLLFLLIQAVRLRRLPTTLCHRNRDLIAIGLSLFWDSDACPTLVTPVNYSLQFRLTNNIFLEDLNWIAKKKTTVRLVVQWNDRVLSFATNIKKEIIIVREIVTTKLTVRETFVYDFEGLLLCEQYAGIPRSSSFGITSLAGARAQLLKRYHLPTVSSDEQSDDETSIPFHG